MKRTYAGGTGMRRLGTGVAVSIMLAAGAAGAATPRDTLVEGFAFDDIISTDPAENFELSGAEIVSNTYDPLVRLDVDDPTQVKGAIADSWTVSEDGLTFTFKLKPGLRFASGNPITAEDVAYSFERVVKLDKSPGFLLTQFGLKADNVVDKARAVDPTTFALTLDAPYAPTFVLNVLTANPLSIVDKRVVVAHVKGDDFGNGWLKTNYAGSGAFRLREWRANEVVVLERNDNHGGEKAKLARVIYRFMKESSGQRLALEAGDIDVARNLEPGDFEAIAKKDGIATASRPKGTIYYVSLNQKNKDLAKPEVREALKYLVDYDAIGATLIKGIGEIHQTFLPKGQLGAQDDKPYRLDVAKAKALLARAGYPDGFTVTMDTRSIQPVTGIAEAFQQTLAQAGVKLRIIPGDGKQVLTKYRARNHDLYIGQWGSDYWDPNSNAETFSANPDNSDEGKTKTLAWRNAWDVPELTKATKAALLEKDGAKRAALYRDLQAKVLQTGPFVILFQQTEVAGYRGNVRGFRLGPTFDTNSVATVSKE